MASEERQMDAYCTKLETDNERLRGALQEICAVDKAAPDRKDCHIWADMLAIASYALTGRDSFMSLDELAGAAVQPIAVTGNCGLCGQPRADHAEVAPDGKPECRMKENSHHG